jgi:hypothetical protein
MRGAERTEGLLGDFQGSALLRSNVSRSKELLLGSDTTVPLEDRQFAAIP